MQYDNDNRACGVLAYSGAESILMKNVIAVQRFAVCWSL